MRSAWYVVGLAFGRLRRRDGGALVAALGIAAAAAVLAGILAGATVAKDRGVAQDVERIPASARAVRAVWFGVPASGGERWSSLDRSARQALSALPAGEPTAVALVRESTVGGRFVGLAAVDGLAPHVLLRSGRLPRACTAERCEVLRLRGAGALPDVPGLHVVEVGRAVLRSSLLFGDFLAPTDNALADAALAPALRDASRYHRPPPAPLVVAEGIDALVSSPVLARSYRSYAWVQALGAGTPRLWQIDDLVGRADSARTALEAQSPSWALTVPAEELRETEHVATVAGRRLLLVGGEAAALLVAFAVLAAGALRRDLASARRRLTWHGARRWQGALLTGTECAAVGFGGALAGWIVGGVGGAVAAAAADAPVGAVLAESVLSPTGLLLGLGTAVVAAAVIAVTVSLAPRPPRTARDARPRGGRRAARGPGDRRERCGGRRRPRLGRRGPRDAPRAAGPGRLRSRRRRLSPAACRRAPGGPAWSKGKCPPRRRVARTLGRRRRDRGGVPRARRRARRPRRDVPLDAPDGRARPGGLRRADRRRRPRGPPLARPRAAGRATRAATPRSRASRMSIR